MSRLVVMPQDPWHSELRLAPLPCAAAALFCAESLQSECAFARVCASLGGGASARPHQPCRLVGEHGEGNWSAIAKHFPGRIGKQCRERWHNQLRPDIKRDAWSATEEQLLINAHRDLGNKCAAPGLPGPISVAYQLWAAWQLPLE